MKSFKHGRRILVAAVVTLGLLCGGTAMAAPVKVRTAMDVLKNMFDTTETVKTSEGDSVINLTIKTPVYKYVPSKKKPATTPAPTENNGFSIGSMDSLGLEQKRVVVGTKKTNVNVYMHSKIDQDADAMGLSFHVDIKTDKEKASTVEGEVRTFTNEVYMKLTKLDLTDSWSKEGGEELAKVQTILGQWIKIDDSMVEGSLSKRSAYGTELLGLKQELTAEDAESLQYFMDLVTRNKVLTITALRGQTIAKHATYHYAIALNKRGLANAIVEAEEKYGNSGISYDYNYDAKGKAVKPKTAAQKKNDMYKKIAQFNLPTIEVWIGRDNFYLYKYIVRYTSPTKGLFGEPYSFAVTMANTLKSANEPVSIAVPDNARGYEEIEEQLFGEQRKLSRDSRRLADLRQIQTALELYYVDTGSYPVIPNGLNLGEEQTRCFDKTGFHAECAYSSGYYDEQNNYVMGNYPYMSYVPKDPKDGAYWYISQNGSTYSIKTDLEIGASGLSRGQIVAQPNGITSTNPLP